MFVIDTGFKRVEAVALGPCGAVAALKGFKPVRGDSFALSPEQRAVLADETAWEAKLWRTVGAEPVWEGNPESFVFGLALDPQTGRMVHADAKDGVYFEGAEGGPFELEDGPLRTFAFSPDGGWFVVGCERWDSPDRPKLSVPSRLVSFTRKGRKGTWMPAARVDGDGFLFEQVAFFSDGTRFAAREWSKVKRGREFRPGDTPTLSVRDAKTLEVVDETTFTTPADELAVCGEQLVVRGKNSFRVWSATDLSAEPVEVKRGRATLTAVAADVHGRSLFTASGNNVTRWDVSNWTPAGTYDWQIGRITCLAVSPAGLTAAAGSASGKVVIWDVE